MEKKNGLWAYLWNWVMQLQAKMYGVTQLVFLNKCMVAQVLIAGSDL